MTLKTHLTSRWKHWLVAGVVAVAVAGVGGPFLYIQFNESGTPAPFSLSTPESAPTAALDGTWTVASGSQAGYRVGEVVGGQRTTAVGRTGEVSGSATISGTQVAAGTVSVNLAAVESNESARDDHVRSLILHTDQFPAAVFTLTAPVELGTIPAGQLAHVPATGELTLHGVTKPATVNLDVSQSGDTLNVRGTTDVTFADYGIQRPTGGLAKIDPASQIEFLLQLSQA